MDAERAAVLRLLERDLPTTARILQRARDEAAATLTAAQADLEATRTARRTGELAQQSAAWRARFQEVCAGAKEIRWFGEDAMKAFKEAVIVMVWQI